MDALLCSLLARDREPPTPDSDFFRCPTRVSLQVIYELLYLQRYGTNSLHEARV